MADEIPSEGPLTREQVSGEMNRVANDASHPWHAGYRAGLPSTTEQIEALYRRIPGSDAPVVSDAVRTEASSEAEDQAFRESVMSLVEERGIPLDAAGTEGARLFKGKQGDEALMCIEQVNYGLMPEAEKQAHLEFGLWLSDLAGLRQAPAGDAPADFEAALQAELRKSGINVDHLDQELTNLFGRQQAALQHVFAYLDSFPPGVRLAAYVRSARALVTLTHLRQSVA